MQAGIYFLLFVGFTGFIQWINKKNLSLFFWGFTLYVLYWFIDIYYQSGLVALLIALGLVFFLSYIFIVIDDYMMPINTIFIFIKEFDLTIANGVVFLIRKLALLVRSYIKPGYIIKPAMGIGCYELIVANIKNQHWGEVEKHYQFAEPEEKSLLLESIPEMFKPDEFSHWIDEDSANSVAILFYARAMLVSAWESRGSSSSDMVKNSEFETFFKRLYIARQAYLRVIELNPECVEAYVGLIPVVMGLQEEKKEAWDYFIQLIKLQAEHFWGHMAMLTLLCEKWSGSNEAMFNFAKHSTKNVAKGSPLHGITAMAHIERWLYYSLCHEEDEYHGYFRSEQVMEEINTAFRLFMGDSNRDYSLSDYAAMNIFAFCFYQMEQANECLSLLKLIDNRATIYPWYYCDSGILGHLDTSYIYSYILRKMGL